MNISFGNIGTVNTNFGIVGQTQVEGPGAGRGTQANAAVRHSGAEPPAVDPLLGSEPVAEIPDGELVRDDALGRLVSSAFNLPAPPMPEFKS